MSLRNSRLSNLLWTAKHRLLHALKLREHMRGHPALIERVLGEVLARVPEPVVIETGCIRSRTEGTLSTVTIAARLAGRGRFYTFELEPAHIAICREICTPYNQDIHYVQGDSVGNLSRLSGAGELDRIDYAFFDSVNDGGHIFREFQTVEDRFPAGSVVMVDDVLWGAKGTQIKPYLEGSPDWDTELHNIENGILIARRR